MNILSILFPPRLPGKVKDWDLRVEPAEAQGSAGPARPKPYRNGIDRYFAEADALVAYDFETPSTTEVEVKLEEFMAAFPAVTAWLRTKDLTRP